MLSFLSIRGIIYTVPTCLNNGNLSFNWPMGERYLYKIQHTCVRYHDLNGVKFSKRYSPSYSHPFQSGDHRTKCLENSLKILVIIPTVPHDTF